MEPHVRREIAPIAALGGWHMGQWGEMEDYVTTINAGASAPGTSTGAFLSAVLAVHHQEYKAARGVCFCGNAIMKQLALNLAFVQSKAWLYVLTLSIAECCFHQYAWV